jgi:hypothetical protein
MIEEVVTALNVEIWDKFRQPLLIIFEELKIW